MNLKLFSIATLLALFPSITAASGTGGTYTTISRIIITTSEGKAQSIETSPEDYQKLLLDLEDQKLVTIDNAVFTPNDQQSTELSITGTLDDITTVITYTRPDDY